MSDEEIKIRVDERRKAVEIAYEFMRDYNRRYVNKKAAGNQLAFIEQEKSEVARYIGNAISGHNALSVALKVSDEQIIKEENETNSI